MHCFKPVFFKLYSVLCVVIVLQSCGPGQPGVYKNSQIKSGKLDDFHKLNKELFDAVKAGKEYDVENMMSKPLLSTGGYQRKVEIMGIQAKLADFNMLDEYYIVNYKPTDTHKINTTATDGNKYIFYAATITEEMYVAFFVPKAKGDKQMITVVYCKYEYGWRINDIEVEPYTIDGKTAPQLYKIAQQQFTKGYLIDAVMTMELANKCMRPNELWVYPEDADMGAFYGKVADLANHYRFPMVMDKVASKPRIFQLTHSTTNEGVFPVVDYVSKINIKDTVALKKEKDEVVKAIGDLFPGLDKDKKYIYFTAFADLPSKKKSPRFFDMVAVLK